VKKIAEHWSDVTRSPIALVRFGQWLVKFDQRRDFGGSKSIDFAELATPRTHAGPRVKTNAQ
jgi:hypothetical protein